MTRLINGQVLIDQELKQVDLRFNENGILDIAPNLGGGDEAIDCTGKVIIPGLVDVHVHLREPGYEQKETIYTGTMAAAAGGFTTIMPMPNLNPHPDHVLQIQAYLEKIQADAQVRVIPYATITKEEKGKEVVDIKAISALTRYFSDDGVGIQSDAVMKEAMDKAKEVDAMIVMHTEDRDQRLPYSSVHDSNPNYVGIPSSVETDPLKRDIELAYWTKVRYHACHISAKESVQALAEAKKRGADVSGEVTAHHLLLEASDFRGPNWKMNPPLRDHEDRMALIEGLESGALDLIANDHAPHTKEEKSRPVEKSPFGIVALETSFPLLYTYFVKRGRWTLAQLVNWMSTAPAKRFGLSRTGKIEEGYRADLVVLDLNQPYVIDPDHFQSKGKNTPFAGWEVYGKIERTICDGKTVWKGNE